MLNLLSGFMISRFYSDRIYYLTAVTTGLKYALFNTGIYTITQIVIHYYFLHYTILYKCLFHTCVQYFFVQTRVSTIVIFQYYLHI